ncbi:TIGR01459 family HAD-type hydrolase [Acuticoccus sp. M5D2P5]|uniref:TIGR01459 family HAD-type hydrolase n=1 Tax=Acuticoccus kalidii TaxID=2910977 RepID=UPI001F3A4867|nr:TIGR01459 family HAD-type hydrolase [Acuticoccus kalidii]MCF3933501.1 TIGR01459 family HAD-type hydrolase [Acuticoccus kalidii]
MSNAPLSGLSSIADDYDAILCDVWGVLHNGIAAHDGAADALARFRAHGPVVLITNAPRPSGPVVTQLESFGIPQTAFDTIVSSGDVVRTFLAERGVRSVHHIGPTRDLPLYEGTPITLAASADEADAVIIAGLRDDTTETPDDYRDELAHILTLGIPVICANPDVIVVRGTQLIYCAGALANLYDEMGGATLHFGKPHAPIYKAALEEVRRRAPDAARVLVIGDGLPTDILGAKNQGFDALFITDGIHADELGPRGAPDPAKVTERLAADRLTTTHFAPRLAW